MTEKLRSGGLAGNPALPHSDIAYNCTRSQWQIDVDVFYKTRLQTATIRRGRGVVEDAIRADVIKPPPATALLLWRDALLKCPIMPGKNVVRSGT